MMRKLSMFAALACVLVAMPAVAEDSLDDVLSGYYDAIGGAEAWEAVGSLRMNGTMNMGQGMEAPFTITFQQPMKTRLEFTFQGMTGIQAYDGETAWFIMPFMGKTEPEPMPDDMADQLKEQADLNPFIDWEEKGYMVELLGKEEIEGTDAYKVKLVRANGNERLYYFDADHYLPFKVDGTSTIQGNEMKTETILGDYKEVNGLVVAHSIETRPEGAPGGQVITIDSVDTEADLGDDHFAMPMVEPAAADG